MIFRRPPPRRPRFAGWAGPRPSTSPAVAPTLSASGMRLRCWADRQTLRFQGFGTGRRPGATDYELSLGKIVDTLTADYRDFFERSPDFDIYDDCVVFELGLGGEGGEGRPPTALRGKRAYSRALLTLQRLATSTIRDGEVKCSVQHGPPCDELSDLRVNWTCNGHTVCFPMPVHISAISLYYIAPLSVTQPCATTAPLHVAAPFPSHRIHRHKIEFLEIHPPKLRSMLQWWEPQLLVPQPALAVHGRLSEVALDLRFVSCEEESSAQRV